MKSGKINVSLSINGDNHVFFVLLHSLVSPLHNPLTINIPV